MPQPVYGGERVCVCVQCGHGLGHGVVTWLFFCLTPMYTLCTPCIILVCVLETSLGSHPLRILNSCFCVCVFFPNSDELRAKDLVMMGYSYSFWFSLVSFF